LRLVNENVVPSLAKGPEVLRKQQNVISEPQAQEHNSESLRMTASPPVKSVDPISQARPPPPPNPKIKLSNATIDNHPKRGDTSAKLEGSENEFANKLNECV
jgi:hypothetical protein